MGLALHMPRINSLKAIRRNDRHPTVTLNDESSMEREEEDDKHNFSKVFAPFKKITRSLNAGANFRSFAQPEVRDGVL